MRFSRLGWCGTLVALLFLVLGGCDAPTGNPSLNTETSINVPLVSDKTFSFLGDEKTSEFDPLIDTTSSEFDSLFVVGEDPKDISIVQEVDNFDIGSLDDALDEAGGNLAVNDNFSESLIQNSDLGSQDIDANYSNENSEYTSNPAATSASGIFDTDSDDAIVVPFPASNVLEAPDFGTVDGSGATVESVMLTSDAGSVNEITFTLTNNGSNELDDGTGNPPQIQIEDTEGSVEVLASSSFGQTIAANSSASTTVDVSGLSLGNNTQYRLIINSADTDFSNTIELETALSEWRYQATTLSDAGNINIDASESSISTVGSGSSQFEGIDVGSGSITLAVDNQFSFPIEITQIQLQNASEPNFGNISDLNIDESLGTIASGSEATKTKDLSGRGISKEINVSVTAAPASSQITVTADGRINVSNTGALTISTMYFRPDGETVKTSGEVALDNERITFQDGDFAELSNAVIDVNSLTVEPDVTFDTLALSYPDLRRKNVDGQGSDYQAEDSLEVQFVENPSGDFEFDRDRLDGTGGFEVDLSDENLQLHPSAGNQVAFSVRGKLESDNTAQGIVSFDDQISATTSIGNFEIQKIDVSQADPFNVEVTSDADGNGEIDLAEDNEVRTASFDGFEGVAGRIDGLELANTSLDFTIETENLASTDAQLFAAIQGNTDSGSVLLAGEQGTEREASPFPFGTTFADGGQTITSDSLIKLGVDLQTTNLGEQVQRTKTIDSDNSNVSTFINSLPTEIRFAGQAEMNTDGGDLKLQKPVNFDAAFTLDVPLQIRDSEDFEVRDTIDADFSDLEDLTDSEEDLNISKAQLRFRYTNGLPLGADVEMIAVDADGDSVETFSNDDLRLEPAPKDSDGAAEEGGASGEFVFTLGDTKEDLRDLADGRELYLILNMTQEQGGAPARLRADDTIRLNMRLNVEASVNTGG